MAKLSYLLFFCASILSSEAVSEMPSVQAELQDLADMIPYERLLILALEYGSTDSQVRELLEYFNSQPFKNNVLAVESSSQFISMAMLAKRHNVSLFSMANKVNYILELPMVLVKRPKRAPGGDGVLCLIRDCMEITPLGEIREVYRYKVDTNPEFKDFVSTMLSGYSISVLSSLLESRGFKQARKDLLQMNIPVDEIFRFFTERLILFLHLECDFPVEYSIDDGDEESVDHISLPS